jgi:hypothetical protein
LPADGEDVPADGREGGELADPAGEPEGPGEQDRPCDDVRDVLAADREQVVEPGGAEAVA